jgi:outer membrane protein
MSQVNLIAILTAICTLALMPAARAELAPGSKVAFMHMQKAIQSVGEGKKAQATLKKEWEDRKKKMETEGQKFQAAVENFRKQAMVMDEASRLKKEEELNGEMQRLQQMEQRLGQEFQKRDLEISEPIIKKIRSIVATISKEKGYTIVIDGNENTVIYAQDQDDITDEVIKRYDKK